MTDQIRVSRKYLARKYCSSVILKQFYFRFGFLILKKEKQIPENRIWECWRGSRSRSTPKTARPSQDQRLRTRGRGRPCTL
jgi:hypothetical protein